MTTLSTGLATSFINFSRPGASGGGATTTLSNGKIGWAGHNLLLASESFDSSSWTKAFITATANQAVAPNGTTTADVVIPTTDNGTHQIYQNVTVPVGVPFTMGFFVKPNGYTKFALVENQQTGYYVTYNASGSGSVITESSATGTITPLANGWYYVTHTSVSGAASYRFALLVLPNSYTSGTFAGAWQGDGTSGMYVWGATIFRADLGGMQLNPAQPAGMQSYYPTTPRNLLGYTEDFSNNAIWGAGAYGTANSVVGPNGLQTADTIAFTAALKPSISQTISSGIVGGSTYTISVWAKASSTGTPATSFRITTNNTAAWSTGVTQKFTLTSSWQRFSVTGVIASSGTAVRVLIGATNLDGSEDSTCLGSVDLYGIQLSDSASLDTYVPVYGAAVTSAAYYAPRLDFDGATLSPKGLLVEEARTNLFLYSNDMAFSPNWTAYSTSLVTTSNSATGPDGLTSANTITLSANGRVQILTLTSGTTYTISVWLRTDTGTKSIQIGDINQTGGLTTVTVTTTWQRFSFTFTKTNTAGYLGIYQVGAGLSTSGTLYAYGWQFEAGSFATSYIPTGSATATRAADVASVSTQAFPYSSSASSLVVSAVSLANQYSNVLELSASASAFGLLVYHNLGSISAYVDASSVSLGSATAGTVQKIGIAYDGSSNGAVRNGGTVSSVGTTVSAAANKLGIGSSFSGGSTFNGHIRQITYLPRRISNAELISRTS